MMLKFLTSNMHKYNEISAFLGQLGIECQWVKMKYEEIQGESTEEISRDSAVKLSRQMGDKFFLEDTGLYINSLKGFPGPYSSYISKTIGNDGILDLLKNKERSAYFLTVISYFDGMNVLTFQGKLNGRIAEEEKGKTGFGFDPVFVPENCENTLAEMSIEEKNQHSHRINALKSFISYLEIED